MTLSSRILLTLALLVSSASGGITARDGGQATRALARVRVGYAGADMLLEKQDGAWNTTKLTQTWIE